MQELPCLKSDRLKRSACIADFRELIPSSWLTETLTSEGVLRQGIAIICRGKFTGPEPVRLAILKLASTLHPAYIDVEFLAAEFFFSGRAYHCSSRSADSGVTTCFPCLPLVNGADAYS